MECLIIAVYPTEPPDLHTRMLEKVDGQRVVLEACHPLLWDRQVAPFRAVRVKWIVTEDPMLPEHQRLPMYLLAPTGLFTFTPLLLLISLYDVGRKIHQVSEP